MIKLILIIIPAIFGVLLMSSFNIATSYPFKKNPDNISTEKFKGIWRTENNSSPIKLFYFSEGEKPIVVYQSNLIEDTSVYRGVKHTITRVCGDCFFYYETKTQSLEYLATFSDGALTIQKRTEVIQFNRVDKKDLTQSELEAVLNSQPDTVMMFGYRKPSVYEYYHCNDSTLRIKDELYIPDQK